MSLSCFGVNSCSVAGKQASHLRLKQTGQQAGRSLMRGCREASVASAIETIVLVLMRCSAVVAGKQASHLRLKQAYERRHGSGYRRCREASVASAIETTPKLGRPLAMARVAGKQ